VYSIKIIIQYFGRNCSLETRAGSYYCDNEGGMIIGLHYQVQ